MKRGEVLHRFKEVSIKVNAHASEIRNLKKRLYDLEAIQDVKYKTLKLKKDNKHMLAGILSMLIVISIYLFGILSCLIYLKHKGVI